MTASIQTPADAVNAALTRIGYKMSVGSLLDGSDAAKAALNLYGQTRDDILRSSDPNFAKRALTMTLLKAAPVNGYVPPIVPGPTYPPLPWYYEYAWPSDCLELRSIRPQPVFIQDFDPQPVSFLISNDNAYSPPQRVILCNIQDAIMTYTGRITDLTTWDVSSVEELIAALARRLTPSFVKDLNAVKLAMGDEQQETVAAEKEQG